MLKNFIVLSGFIILIFPMMTTDSLYADGQIAIAGENDNIARVIAQAEAEQKARDDHDAPRDDKGGFGNHPLSDSLKMNESSRTKDSSTVQEDQKEIRVWQKTTQGVKTILTNTKTGITIVYNTAAKGMKETGHAVTKAGTAAGRGVVKAGEGTGKAVQKTDQWIKEKLW
jgi:hypothetical protein